MPIIWCAVLGLGPMEEPRSLIEWHWEDEFSTAERDKVEDWLNSVTGAVESTLGVYPFTVHFYIHRRKGSSEPVPWASTRRQYVQGVDFHIDPSFSLQAFLDDWTAPHEISHLSIPYLGQEQSWFAEGYASFMQYQVMQKLGICSEQEVGEIYAEKIERVRPYYDRLQCPESLRAGTGTQLCIGEVQATSCRSTSVSRRSMAWSLPTLLQDTSFVVA